MTLLPTQAHLLAEAIGVLEQAGIDSSHLDARLLMAHALGLRHEEILFSQEKTLNNDEISVFNALVARRAQYEPIAYIIGNKEFWSLDFCVTRDTLIPRPDSETLIEAALKRVKSRKTRERAKPLAILDIGTGTGCLLITMLKELPAAMGVGIDSSKHALLVAEKNANRHAVADRAQFIESHWCDAIDGTFDLIISNPPYIAESAMDTLMADVSRFEPHAALFAGPDGMDAYRALSSQVARLLNPEGHMLFEVGQGQEKEVSELLSAQGLSIETPERDLAGITRCVAAQKH